MSSPRKAPGARSGEQEPLSRTRVAAAALALADREGLDALSMRRLASELGIGTMTLYGHVKDKDELLDAMVEQATAELDRVELSGSWQDALRTLMRAIRQTLARHPSGLHLRVKGPLLNASALRVTEAGMQILERAGFDKASAAHAYRALFLYTFGFASFNSPPDPEARKRQTRSALLALPPDEFPALSSAAQEAAETMAGDEPFEFGLDRLLDGLEALLRSSED
jgi:AcrR family transcriptional regulator